jgi:hypothetical protein
MGVTERCHQNRRVKEQGAVMENRVLKWCLATLLAMSFVAANAADLSRPSSLTDEEWDKIREHVLLLDKVSFVPSLLPVIMKHRDALGLSDDQKKAFRDWRKKNYQRMVDIMNDVIERRIALSKTALDPAVANSQLVSQQQAILALQTELLLIRLSCREIVVNTFSPEQWSSFAFVLEEYPNLAGLMQ